MTGSSPGVSVMTSDAAASMRATRAARAPDAAGRAGPSVSFYTAASTWSVEMRSAPASAAAMAAALTAWAMEAPE